MVGTVQKRQLGRKMQILHKLATCFLCKITDAPHTGARLETTTLLYRKAHFRPILGDFAASLLLNKRAKRQNISAAYLI